MIDTDARLWHPWLRINRVLRLMLHTRWGAEVRAVAMLRRALWVVALIVTLSAPARADEPRVRAYALPQHGTLQLAVPAFWKDEVRQPRGREPLTIALTPDGGPGFAVFVVPSWPVVRNPPPVTAESLRRLIEKAATDATRRAVEQKIEVKELKGASGPGYYFTATDPAPAPGEYKYLTQGTIKVGEILAEFTILTNDGQGDVVQAALSMMAGATHTAR